MAQSVTKGRFQDEKLNPDNRKVYCSGGNQHINPL